MKIFLTYFRWEADLPYQSTTAYLTGQRRLTLPVNDAFPETAAASLASRDPAIPASSLLLFHHEEPSRGSGPIYRYQENRGEERR